MDKSKLDTFVSRLCRKNLNSDRVKCCAQCPFEEEITKAYPELGRLFVHKRTEGIVWND